MYSLCERIRGPLTTTLKAALKKKAAEGATKVKEQEISKKKVKYANNKTTNLPKYCVRKCRKSCYKKSSKFAQND